VNSLASRKQLLVAESELNRAQLVQEWQTMRAEVHSLTNQARTLKAIAAAVASLIAGLSSCRNQAAAPADKKPSWWQTILKGAGIVSTCWSAFRSSRRE
jgi:hypothetical protein